MLLTLKGCDALLLPGSRWQENNPSGVFLSRRDSGVWGWSERGVAGAWSRTFLSSEHHAVVASKPPTLLFEGWGTDSGASWSNQSILKEISPGCSLEGMMLKLNLQSFGHLMRRVDSLEKTLMLGGIGGRRRRG